MKATTSVVLFSDRPRVNMRTLGDDLRERCPDLGEPKQLLATGADAVFFVGDSVVLLGSMWLPVPSAYISGLSDHQPLWPGHKADVAKHQCHMIVRVNAPTGDQSKTLRLLTQITASVMTAATDAVGVFWPMSPRLIGAKQFGQELEADSEVLFTELFADADLVITEQAVVVEQAEEFEDEPELDLRPVPVAAAPTRQLDLDWQRGPEMGDSAKSILDRSGIFARQRGSERRRVFGRPGSQLEQAQAPDELLPSPIALTKADSNETPTPELDLTVSTTGPSDHDDQPSLTLVGASAGADRPPPTLSFVDTSETDEALKRPMRVDLDGEDEEPQEAPVVRIPRLGLFGKPRPTRSGSSRFISPETGVVNQ